MEKVGGVQIVRVSLKEGATILDVKPGSPRALQLLLRTPRILDFSAFSRFCCGDSIRS
jgi:hypothetical protein